MALLTHTIRATYSPFGAPSALPLGNGVTQSYSYNKRLQPTEMSAALVSGSNFFEKLYCYGPSTTSAFNSTVSCPTPATTDHGNVLNVLDVNVSRSYGYSYDHLNRIFAFSGGDGTRQQTYNIDPWGNTQQVGNVGVTAFSFGTPTVKNRSPGLNYDFDGNVINWAFQWVVTLMPGTSRTI